MSTFERYLTVWVALCIVVGIALGDWFPIPFRVIWPRRNLLMIIPMLLKIDIGKRVGTGAASVTLFIN